MAFSGKFLGVQDTLQTNFGSGIHTLAEVGQGVKDGVWPTNYKINQSLRFDNASSTYLTRTAGDGSTTTFTVSGWYKKVKSPTTYQNIFSSYTSGTDYFVITVGDATVLNETFRIQSYSGTELFLLRTSALYRDYGEWYHFTVVMDSTQTVESDRAKIYINGELITEFNNVSYPSQNLNLRINGTTHNIGSFNTTTQVLDGYVAEVNFIDGLALDPSYFGFTHPITKKWSPKRYTGEYGSTGFYLDFAGKNVGTGAVGTVGEDKSGNGNHFTSSGIDHYDVVPDSPTNNFATLNPLVPHLGNLKEGNCNVNGGTSGRGVVPSTIKIPDTGTWYWEIYVQAVGYETQLGLRSEASIYEGSEQLLTTGDYMYYFYNGNWYVNGTSSGFGAAYTSGDIISFSFNVDTSTISVYKNNALQGTKTIDTSVSYFPAFQYRQSNGVNNLYINHGQDHTFSGTKTPTKVYTDANGRGQFFYEPPAGALALCSANLEQAKNTPTEYITDETDQHRLTYNGGAGVSKFSPYAQDGYSVSFNGANDDTIRVDYDSSGTTPPDSVKWLVDGYGEGSSTSDHTGTIEAWIYPTKVDHGNSGTEKYYIASILTLGNTWLSFGITENNKLRFYWWTGVQNYITGTGLVQLNKWNHVAVVINGTGTGNLKLYLNGVEGTDGTTEYTGSIWSTTSGGLEQLIGGAPTSYGTYTYQRFYGHIADLRIIPNVALYTSNFTPPTEPLTAITGTRFLLSTNSNRFLDSSSPALSVENNNGSPSISDFSPYSPDPNIVTQDLTLNGGGSFHGFSSASYIEIENSTDFDLGDNYTIEFWIYPESIVSADRILSDSDGTSGWWIETYNGNVKVYGYNGSSYTTVLSGDGTPNLLKSWNHVAVVSNSTDGAALFINGIRKDTATTATLNRSSGTASTLIGTMSGGLSGYFDGFVSDIRVIKGQSLYNPTSSNFTVPSAPLTAVTNTKLLLQPYSKVKPSKGIFNRTDAYPYEETGKSLTYVNGASVIDTSPYKSGDVGSFHFDGTDDYVLTEPNSNLELGTGEFTIELWFKSFSYSIESSASRRLISTSKEGNATNNLQLIFNTSTGVVVVVAQAALFTLDDSSAGSGSDGRWHHVAVVGSVSGTDRTLSAYFDGVKESTTYTFNYELTGNSGSPQYVLGSYGDLSGGKYDGFLSDIRVVKGAALYTSSFTPPAYPLRSDYYTTDGSDPATSGTRSAVSGTVALFTQPGKREDKSEVFKFASLIKNNYSGTGITLANNGYSVTSTAAHSVHSSFSVSSGKWYVEASGTAGTSGGYIGVQEANTASPAPTYDVTLSNDASQGIGLWTPAGYIYGGNGTSDFTGISAPGTALGGTDVVALAIDMDASPKTVQWLVNNTRVITVKLGSTEYIAADGTTGTATATFADINNLYVTYNGGATGTRTADWNFGQDPTILGNVTPSGGTNADNGFPDEDGNGSFRYAPPSGYKAMGKYEKPQKLVSDPALHPEKYFNTVLYTGNGGTQSITGLDFKPDFVWIKERSSTSTHILCDTIRGPLKYLQSNSTDAEASSSNIITSFNTDGFTSGPSGATNESNQTYVAWCWKAGGDPVPNTDGTIPSLVSANKDAGFSIASFTGNGTAGQTIGHGLSKPPELYIWKRRDSTSDWGVHTTAVDGSIDYLVLNSTTTKTDVGDYLPSTTTMYISGTGYGLNVNGGLYIAYTWHSVPGFSKFGSYTGNGSSDGPFVYTGFRPAWVMIKHSSGSVNSTFTSWMIVDNTRDTYNPTTNILWANRNASEGYRGDGSTALSGDIGYVDFLSNGFKIRDSNSAEVNDTSDVYIYAAFAESPFSRSTAR